MDANSVFTKSAKEVLGAGDELAQCFARNGSGVAVNCAGNKNAVNRADAEQVVDVHYEAVLRGLTEARGVTRFAIVQVGEGALGARAVGVDNITLIRSAGEDVRADLTKRSGKYTTVKIVHDGVYFGLRGGDAALGVAIG